MSDKPATGFERFFRRWPRQARSMALVDALIGALEAQLARSDHPENWSLDALVEHAGVGVASFYEYFSNKDSLLGAFVGRLNSRNFEVLLLRLDEHHYGTLDETVAHVARAIVDIYLGSPRTTRAAIVTVGRLNLLGPIHTERDRFAMELTRRARPFLPDADERELVRTMQLVADGVMGVVIADLLRKRELDLTAYAEELTAMSLAVIRSRHAQGAESGGSRG